MMMMIMMMMIIIMHMMQDILDYLNLFTDTTESVNGDKAAVVHPADMVLEAFKDEETSKLTLSKLDSFLQEVHAIHGKRFVSAPWPAPLFWTLATCFVFVRWALETWV